MLNSFHVLWNQILTFPTWAVDCNSIFSGWGNLKQFQVFKQRLKNWRLTLLPSVSFYWWPWISKRWSSWFIFCLGLSKQPGEHIYQLSILFCLHSRWAYKLGTWWITNQENAMHKCGRRVYNCIVPYNGVSAKLRHRRRGIRESLSQRLRRLNISSFTQHWVLTSCKGVNGIKYMLIYYRNVYTHIHNFRRFQASPCQGEAITLNYIHLFDSKVGIAKKFQ